MKKKLEWFSVLLLYPDYLAETLGHDTTYRWVRALNSLDAIERARRQVVRAGLADVGEESDFHPLIVLRGCIHGQPTE